MYCETCCWRFLPKYESVAKTDIRREVGTKALKQLFRRFSPSYV